MNALYLALAAGVIATTVSKAKVFAPLRRRARKRNAWLGYLVACPYCVTHWTAFGLQAIYQVRLIRSGAAAVDVIVSTFVIIGVAALVPAVLRRLVYLRRR